MGGAAREALRLYGRLGLLPPVRTDPVNGYRFYREDQIADARLVALLRRLGMPLHVIADIKAKVPGEAAEAVASYWADVESVMADRRVLVSYIQAKLTGADMARYDVQTRMIPERMLLSTSRHLHADETDAFFGEAFARLRSAAPGVAGIAGRRPQVLARRSRLHGGIAVAPGRAAHERDGHARHPGLAPRLR